MESIIEIKNIGQLTGNFIIPDYQRGYRWGKTEVLDLMQDLWSFYCSYIKNEEKSYSLQPLVVKKRLNERELLDEIHQAISMSDVKRILRKEQNWEVIDGQQRLTTILIMLQTMGCEQTYSIVYDIIEGSKEIINKICSIKEEQCDTDINLSYMYDAYTTICDFLKNEDIKKNLLDFSQVILKHVSFIWYVAGEDENSLEIFKRLNIGKISLTESELIKALFLNKRNFHEQEYRKAEIAREWDSFEYNLQDEQFWLFVQSDKLNNNPTRINFLLDFYIDYSVDINEEIGKDHVFRSYYKQYTEHPDRFLGFWNGIKEVMAIWKSWYNDVIIYHLVGFLIYTETTTLLSLTKEYKSVPKSKFYKRLYDLIRNRYFKGGQFNVERDYFEDNKKDNKRAALPYLLLLNMLTVIEQNEVLVSQERYKQGIFYKFPFHLFKKENWDIEHIDSATQNELESSKDQMEWICSVFTTLNASQRKKLVDDETQAFYKHFILGEGKSRFDRFEFDSIYNEMQALIGVKGTYDEHKVNVSNWKNKIYNFTLLDEHTNRSYKNAIFPFKRSEIIDKEKGIRHSYYWDKAKKEFISSPDCQAESAFVPPCTQNVFKFAYSRNPESFQKWGNKDADMYKNEIIRLFVKYKLMSKNNGK